MTDEYLISKGFREYKPSPIDHESVIKIFQKRYDDDKGKKYFITVKKWKEWRHPYTGLITPPVYEYNIQLYKKGGRDNAVDLLFASTWDLETVEEYTEKLWNTGLFDYYEKFEED